MSGTEGIPVTHSGEDVNTYRLGINTCFAVKRWPRPEVSSPFLPAPGVRRHS